MDYVRVMSHPEPPIVELARNLLLEAGLHPRPLDYAANVTVAGANQFFWIWVPEPEAKKAVQVLKGTTYEPFLWEGLKDVLEG